MSWLLAGRRMERVLVTRLRYLGDVVMATLVADVLKLGDPDLEVGFLCESAHAPVLENHPSIDRVHRLGASRRGADSEQRRAGQPSPEGRRTLGMVRELRSVGYDLGVDLFFNPRSAWLLRLAGIPLRIGGTVGKRRRFYTHALPRTHVEDPRGVLARCAPGGLGDHLCRLAPLMHEPSGKGFLAWLEDRCVDGPLAPRIPRRGLDAAGQRALTTAGIDAEGPWLLAAPGATWPTKSWPVAHWRVLLEELGEEAGLTLAVLVPPGDDGTWAALPGALPPLPLASALGLAGAARVVVSVDGGVMHAAVAMGVPTLALFGPTDPDIWFPYSDSTDSRVLASRPACHPCDRHECPVEEFVCLPQVSSLEVAAAVRALVQSTRSGGGR